MEGTAYQPLVLVDTAELSRPDWLACRRKGLGGSDAAAVLNISPFRTARDLYYDKLGIVTADDQANWVALEVGNLLEPLVARIFAKKDTPLEPAATTPAPETSAIQAQQQPTSPPAPATQGSNSSPEETSGDTSRLAEVPESTLSEDEKRKAHEEAEAKRKAEWEARQKQKKADEQAQLDRLAAMNDDEVRAASMRRVSADTEKLTRRNMKECVTEHIQTMCIEDPAFARKTMHGGVILAVYG